MKKLFIIGTILVFITNFAYSQNQIFTDSTGKKNLVGKFTWDEWQKEMNWELDSTFTIDAEKLEKVKHILDNGNYSFLIFAGSWCGDSRDGVPIIMEIFKELDLKETTYILYGVDRAKFEPSFHFAEYQLEKVPTLVILKHNSEIGRIVEIPEENWLTDILNIIGE